MARAARPKSRRSTPAARSTHRPGKRLLAHDRGLGHRFIAGADEAGRGCLAGPLVTAAVRFDYRRLLGPDAAPLGHLNDSKKLTPARRHEVYDTVIGLASSWSVVVISASSIDRRGLHKSNLAGLRGAIHRLQGPLDLALIDGFDVSCDPTPSRGIIKGDSTSAAIAAASVIAKVTRDRLMARIDERTGGVWAFAEHVGYATPLHHERIREHGVSEFHRLSFDSAAWRDDGESPRPSGQSEGIAHVVDPFDGAIPIAADQEHIEPVAVSTPV